MLSKLRRYWYFLLFPSLVALLAILLYGLAWSEDPNKIPSVLEQTAAANFELQDLDGKSFSLQQWRGQRVVLNFWGSWCFACRAEAKVLEQGHQQFNTANVQFVGVAVHDNAPDVRRFIAQYKKSYLILIDAPGQTLLEYGVTGIPETFFIDAKGVIVKKITGAVTQEQLEMFLTQGL